MFLRDALAKSLCKLETFFSQDASFPMVEAILFLSHDTYEAMLHGYAKKSLLFCV